jgi:hypothetical protein
MRENKFHFWFDTILIYLAEFVENYCNPKFIKVKIVDLQNCSIFKLNLSLLWFLITFSNK